MTTLTMMNRILLIFPLFLFAATVHAQDMKSMMHMDSEIDVSDVRLCDTRNPSSWRDAQMVEGVSIEEDPSCEPDMPALIATVVKGTNNVSVETLNATGLAPDAVVKGEDRDGDGDPDVIHIKLEIAGLNEGVESLTPFEIAPGIAPGFWVFAPKSTGMATENMSASYLMRMPSPTIRVEQGDEIQLTVENTHYMPHTVHLHGVDHPYLDENGEGNDGVMQTSEMAIMPGESRTYDMTPRVAGTMAYHCHVKPDVHILMGLSGLFIIEENRPNNTLQTLNVGNGKVRYRSVESRATYDGEFDLHYQDIDKEMHEIVQDTNDAKLVDHRVDHEYDVTERTADYFVLNGRSFPYTLRESQLIVDPDNEYLLRILNIGSEAVSLHTHGHKMRVEALDGIDLPAGTEYYRDVVDIHSAQRVDAVLSTRNDGLHSYGEGVWLFHDHEETHITTNGVSPGGGLSMITYRSFLGEQGMPITQGMDLRQFFTEEYYDRSEVEEKKRMKEHNHDTHILFVVVGIGVLLGAFIGMRFFSEGKRTEFNAGFVQVRSLIGGGLLLLLLMSLLYFAHPAAAQELDLSGIHIMPDGSVMLGNGETLFDAYVTPEGMIVLGDGREVDPVIDMRSDKTLGVKNIEEEDQESTESASTPAVPPEGESGPPEEESTSEMGMDMSDGPVSTIESHAGMEGIEGIHIMPNGRVMTGTGAWLDDAYVNADGQIVLGSGEMVTPILDMRAGGGMRRTENTLVVNENFDRLPLGCSEISEEREITVKAGREIAEDFPGTVYTYDTHSIEDIAPCTLLTVTFENMDHVRHQFMVHDLPTDIYPMGMFNIEVTGPGKETGTFITPADRDTLFVHCGVPEHEAKGMVAQIKNGGGDGDLPGIPGLTWSLETGDVASLSTKTLALWGVVGLVSGFGAAYGFVALIQRRKTLHV